MGKRKDKENIFTKKVDRKIVGVAFIFLLLFTIIFSVRFRINNIYHLDKIQHQTNVILIFKTARESYTPGTKYFARINNVSCDNDFETEYSFHGKIGYYVEFDEDGNVVKLYAYDDNIKFMHEGKIIGDDFGFSTDEEKYSRVNNFKLDCNGNIKSR